MSLIINTEENWTGAGISRLTNISSPYTVLNSDKYLFCDTDGGAITVLLPSGVSGDSLTVVNTGSSGNNVTITPNGAELLSGANSNDVVVDGGKIGYWFDLTEGWW